MKKVFPGILFSLFALQGSATAVRIPLQIAIHRSDMTVTLLARGGYCGKGLTLTVRNCSNTEYIVEVPTGLVFKPEDASYQALAIAGSHDMHMMPQATDTQVLNTFCAHCSASSPATGINYSFLKMAERPLLHVLQYIADSGIYNYSGQHAVWAMTDGRSAADVYDFEHIESSKKFAAFVAHQKGEAAPQFYNIYTPPAASAHGPVFAADRSKIIVELEWDEASARNMICEVIQADGSVYREVPGPEYISGGHHRMHTVFELSHTPKGVYYVRARDEMNRLWVEHKVVVE